MKKNLKWRCLSPAVRKTLLAMKLSLLLMLVCTLQLSASVSLGQQVSVQSGESLLGTILEDLNHQTGTIFMYNKEDVDDRVSVELNMDRGSLEEVLDEICRQTPLKYEIIEEFVVITKKAPVIDQPVQQKKITGQVTDKDGAPLPGVSVVIKGTNTGVATDIEGNYAISVEEENPQLIFSFVGMIPQEIVYRGQADLNVVLNYDTANLDEVVVTGFQTISKERATGSFDIINKKTLDKPSMSLATRLVGTTAGMRADLDRNGNPRFEIRGQTSFETNSSPLVVVDGFPVKGNFNSINPNEVESVSVLKDAAAASIWGARAANGVIVVTTKKAGKDTPLRVEFSSFIKLGAKYDLNYSNNKPSSAETIEFEKYAFGKWGSRMIGDTDSWSNLNNARTPAVTLLSEHRLGKISDEELQTGLNQLKTLDNRGQIRKYILQRPISQQYNFSLSGSTSRMSNRLSLLYNTSRSAFKGNESKDYMLNYNVSASLAKWLDLDISSMVQYRDAENGGFGGGDITTLAPYEMLVNPDGSYNNINRYYAPNIERHVPTGSFPYTNWGYNPIEEVNNTNKTNKDLNARIQAGLNVKLFKGLRYTTKIQYELYNNWSKAHYGEKSFYVRSFVNQASSWDRETGEVVANLPKGDILKQDRSESRNYNFRNQLDFNRTFNEVHSINVLVGTEVSQIRGLTFNYSDTYGYSNETLNSSPFPNGTGYPNRIYNWSGYSTNFNYTNYFSDYTTRYFSYYGNIAYSYKNRYDISGSYRTDASNFISDDPKYRYSPFWSVGAGWVISEESFMSEVSWIDRLSMRATFGYNGNSDNSTSFKPLVSVGNRNAETGDLFVMISSRGNPTLRWEKTGTLNLGIDYSLFKGKLYGKIDVYNKHGKDILTNISIPNANGSGRARMNNAEMLNQGIELSFGTNQQLTKDLSWNGNLNFSYNRNEVKKLYIASYSGYDLTIGYEVEGEDANSLWVYKYAGIQNMGSETSPNLQPVIHGVNGAFYPIHEFRSENGLEYLKNSGTRVPPYSVGFSNNFSYKNFDLSFVFTGVFGHKFLRSGFNYPTSSGRNLPNGYLSHLFANGEPIRNTGSIELPYDEYDYDYGNWGTNYMDYMVANAWNIRLQEVNLNYQLPKSIISKLNLRRVVAYVQANNLLTIKGAKEDPDFRRGSQRLLPSYTFGFKFDF
ncbi:SusC/RagA family TonB-linked outer membrane protein [Labilibaculum sp. A4]|uniref:SusC/RagA family TonB-linked outer membrane protein n=1 Tax=Labilibaculum euxinus TaxID=2686357 RepID=UPI000F6179B8|nr:SusC/RagA family TonB-linked outer membrane protein [Labilibaculum euxinus]MDQ1770642.1 SusC/RagA family TonB-linked outer membrane protein [Labilibaculum euxinus]MWN75138.1 SusC/RagA family TonB-linked outer membrane protein [Labilibaculum euxinus]